MTDKLKELLLDIRKTLGVHRWAWEGDYIKRIDEALALPTVEAAEIEVVGYCRPVNISLMKSGKFNGFMVHDEQSETINCALMTVAQHRRILAGVNQQAGGGWIACADRMPESGGDHGDSGLPCPNMHATAIGAGKGEAG